MASNTTKPFLVAPEYPEVERIWDPPAQVRAVEPAVRKIDLGKAPSPFRHIRRQWGSPKRILVQVVRYWRRRRLAGLALDENKKCPACGARFGRIEFEAASNEVRHTCLKCAAIFYEPPIVDPTLWRR